MKKPDKNLGLPSLLALHFLPAVAIFGAYLAAAKLLASRGMPPGLVLNLTFLFIGIPSILLILRYRARVETGSPRISGVIRFRRPLRVWIYLLLVPLFIVYAAFLSALLSAPLGFLQVTVDSLTPSWMVLPHSTATAAAVPAIVVLVSAVLIDGLVNPIVEEIYFRGYLLPRLSPLGLWAPAVHGACFAMAHLWQPHNIPFLLLLVLPLYYVVWRFRNFYLAIFVHCLANLIGAVLSS